MRNKALDIKRYEALYSEVFNFKAINVLVIAFVAVGIVLLVVSLAVLFGSGAGEISVEEFALLMLSLMAVSVGAFLKSLSKIEVNVTADSIFTSLGMFKFNLPFKNVESVSIIDEPSLMRGGWGVRSRLQREGWIVSYTTSGYKRLKFLLVDGRYKVFLLSSKEPEKIIKIFNDYKRY